jgi:hypothetical protein
MDKSGQGPRRSCSQSWSSSSVGSNSVVSHSSLLLQISQLQGGCSRKATPSTQNYGYLGRRTKMMPQLRIGEAAQGAAFASTRFHRLPQNINSCNTSWWSRPRSQVCCVWEAIYVGCHLLYADMTAGSPLPPAESRGEAWPPETAAGLELCQWHKVFWRRFWWCHVELIGPTPQGELFSLSFAWERSKVTQFYSCWARETWRLQDFLSMMWANSGNCLATPANQMQFLWHHLAFIKNPPHFRCSLSPTSPQAGSLCIPHTN